MARPSTKIHLANLMMVTSTGDVVILDTSKVMVVDIKSGNPLFTPKEIKNV